MTVFSAHQYLVGGLVTHGGDIEWHIDEQPAGLTRVWDAEGEAWGEFTDSIGVHWTPVDSDGWPIPDHREVTWAELLQEWGPATDEAPTAEPVAATRTPCDAESPTCYAMPDGTVSCRCIICHRCGRHTGNSNQGHYWARCKVTKTIRDFHFCCPDDCELEAKAAAVRATAEVLLSETPGAGRDGEL
jgi:hypothetical protein